MKMCEYRSCQKIDGHGGQHGRWDAEHRDWVPLAPADVDGRDQ